jgi:quercetin dioxygenase-like cupin family protein
MPFIDLKNSVEKEIFPGFTARGIHTGTMSFIYWDVKAGAEVPEHKHVLKGSFELTVNGETTILEPGVVAVIPAHAVHSGRAITACELLDVFTPEREDYKF